MKLIVRYDPEADVLDIRTDRIAYGATPLEGPELDFIAVESAGENDRDIVGVLIIFAASYMAPYFRLCREKAPPRVGNPEHTRYDRETDTLTWGDITDDPEMVSQAGDLTAYWQLDPCLSEEGEPFYEPIGLSLGNASKHLAPHFVRVEPPAAG